MAVALTYSNPDAALPSLGEVFSLASGPVSRALALRTSEVRKHFSEVLLSQSSTWMTIFEYECPTMAFGLGDPDRPHYAIDQVTQAEILSIPDLGLASQGVRLPPAAD